jgi:hypothetical protein
VTGETELPSEPTCHLLSPPVSPLEAEFPFVSPLSPLSHLGNDLQQRQRETRSKALSRLP